MGVKQLESKKYRDILDLIDELRAQGLGGKVNLPQIIVCGDQSAGKSSVLEAISRLDFPSNDNACTRFATELVLRHDADVGVVVTITPGPNRTNKTASELRDFCPVVNPEDPDLSVVIQDATVLMGIAKPKSNFSMDILRVELSGPNQPNLTIVDLPGLFRVSTGQLLSDTAIVRDMVCSYMENTRSIILAVVSAKNDFALQEVTDLAKKYDPEGYRTLGLITKPDTLDPGSEGEAAYVRLAQNKDVPLRLGWHVLKNRKWEKEKSSTEDRNHSEAKFFAQGIWKSMDPKKLGITTLLPRLCDVLEEQMREQLPMVRQDMERGKKSCLHDLSCLGSVRSSARDRDQYLMRVFKESQNLIKDAVDGKYSDQFFADAETKGEDMRLRAILQSTLTKYRQEMTNTGHAVNIVENLAAEEDGSDDSLSNDISRNNFIKEVQKLLEMSRGRELPGTFNPDRIGELFTKQCQPWRKITTRVQGELLRAACMVVFAIVKSIAAEDTRYSILAYIRPDFESYKADLSRKIDELLKPHYEGHPITYSSTLMKNVHEVQSQRRKQRLRVALKKYLQSHRATGYNSVPDTYSFSPDDLIRHLNTVSGLNLETYASELVIDYMQAYYKLAMDKFVDDFSVLAIENCLAVKLPLLFDMDKFYALTEDQIIELTAESPETGEKRVKWEVDLEAFEKGLQKVQQFEKNDAPNFVGRRNVRKRAGNMEDWAGMNGNIDFVKIKLEKMNS